MEEDNRVREYLSDLNNKTNDPEEMMMEIMEVLNDTVTPIPEVGNSIPLYIMQKLLILHMTNILLLLAQICSHGDLRD